MSATGRAAASFEGHVMDVVFTNPRSALVRLFAGYLDKIIKMKNKKVVKNKMKNKMKNKKL